MHGRRILHMLKIEKLSKTYDTVSTPILSALDLVVESGQSVSTSLGQSPQQPTSAQKLQTTQPIEFVSPLEKSKTNITTLESPVFSPSPFRKLGAAEFTPSSNTSTGGGGIITTPHPSVVEVN